MMTKQERYKQERKFNPTTSARVAWAKVNQAQAVSVLDWEYDRNGKLSASGDVMGLPGAKYTISVDVDELGDESWLGEFKRDWEPGAIQWTGNNRYLQHWVPTYNVDERRRDLSKLGYCKHDAWRIAVQQVKEDLEYATSDHSIYYILVVVEVAGVEVSNTGIGGVTFNSHAELEECINSYGLIDEAIDNAKGGIPGLIAKLEATIAA